MEETYLVPHQFAEAEIVEKKSRFIGHIWNVSSEEEALGRIREMREKYWDASHNTYAYRIRENSIIRYSDDGEPQGTAGRPILDVLTHEKIDNVCLVVTRYFGGTLLGAGGLTRAYSRTARDTLRAAGIDEMSKWVNLECEIPYSLLDSVNRLISLQDGLPGDYEYGELVRIRVCFKETDVDSFLLKIQELSAGAVRPERTGEVYRGRLKEE